MPLLDTRSGKDLMGTFIADLVLQIFCFVAESERISIKRHQAEGIAAARVRGVHLGRPIKEAPDDFAAVVTAWEKGKLTLEDVLARCKTGETTFYRRRRELQLVKNVGCG